jgi:O-antigen ligase
MLQTEPRLVKYSFYFLAFCLPISLGLQNTSFVLAMLATLFIAWRDRLLLLRYNLVVSLSVLLGLLSLVGIFYANADLAWSLRVLQKNSGIFAIFLLAPFFTHSLFKRHYLEAYLWGCVLVFVIAVLGYLHLLPPYKNFQNPAPYFVFFKIYGALFMAFGGFMALTLYRYSSGKRKLFCVLVFLLCTINVYFMSFSKTGYVLYSLLLLLFIFSLSEIKKIIFGLIVLLVLALGIWHFAKNTQDGLLQVHRNIIAFQQGNKDERHNSTAIRLQFVKDTYHMWRQAPIWGQGTGGTLKADIEVQGIRYDGTPLTLTNNQPFIESTYGSMLVEHGLVGLIVLLLLYGVQVWKSFSLGAFYRPLALGFMLVMIIGGIANNMMFDGSTLIFYVFFSSLFFINESELPRHSRVGGKKSEGYPIFDHA